jgi:phi13 family phage major tail protein
MENKIVFGIKNAHYSVITEQSDGTYSYGAPVAYPGATALTLTPKGETTDFYADDILYYTATTNQGYDGTITVAVITEGFRKDVLGEVLEGADGVLTEVNTAKPKKVAWLFEFDGDIKATRHTLYSCTVTRPGASGSTKTTSSEPGTTEMNFVAGPRPSDGIVKRSTTATTPDAVYNAWYTAVYNTVSDTTPPTVTVSPVDGASAVAVSSNVVWTFSEAIRESDVTDANFFVVSDMGVEVTGALSINADKTIVTFNPTANLAALTDYTATVTKNVKDLAGNPLAQNSVTNFTTA